MTSRTKVAIAASSRIAADAGARVADGGGNAVDACIAAMLVSMTTEPGVCSIGGGGFATIWPSGGMPVTIDGNIAMPGHEVAPERLGGGAREVTMDYGGGISTLIGHGSVGTPGAIAALGSASDRHGALPWRELIEPAWEWARDGFPLPQASHDYLIHAHEKVYGWQADSHAALHADDGKLHKPGERIVVPHLADTLRALADGGAQEFYRGDLARAIAGDSDRHDGVLTLADLERYKAELRAPLDIGLGDWRFVTNPPPAVGGATLAAMLLLVRELQFDGWNAASVAAIVRAQASVLRHRHDRLDLADDLPAAVATLLDDCRSGAFQAGQQSASTVHASAVDNHGLACSITMSSGYGSGVMPEGTGIWMNNCLGELELNRRGLIAGQPGTRLSSNMAPSVARHSDGSALAIGSPGADRITSAILQTMVNFIQHGMPLDEAVRKPRAHVELTPAGPRVACEPGVPVADIDWPLRPFDQLSMYFGGVGAALIRPGGTLTVAADPRRSGGEAFGGGA